jgi:hypothetical protein
MIRGSPFHELGYLKNPIPCPLEAFASCGPNNLTIGGSIRYEKVLEILYERSSEPSLVPHEACFWW